jgi:hypothetical protein
LINLYFKALEALYEGYAQKGFGDPSLDGSPFPLGSTATNKTVGVSKILWGRWKPLDATGSKPVDQEAKQHQTN